MFVRSAYAREARFIVELYIIIGLFVTGLVLNIQERTKTLVFVFVFVFVLVDEQTIINILVSLLWLFGG